MSKIKAPTTGTLIAPEPAEQKLSTESSFFNTRSTEGIESCQDDAIRELIASILHVRTIISEAAMTGFNCHDGDWADRLFASQGRTHKALRALPAAALSSSGGEALREALQKVRNAKHRADTVWDKSNFNEPLQRGYAAVNAYHLALAEAWPLIDAALSNGASVIEKQMGGPDTLPAIEGGERATGLGAPLESARKVAAIIEELDKLKADCWHCSFCRQDFRTALEDAYPELRAMLSTQQGWNEAIEAPKDLGLNT